MTCDFCITWYSSSFLPVSSLICIATKRSMRMIWRHGHAPFRPQALLLLLSMLSIVMQVSALTTWTDHARPDALLARQALHCQLRDLRQIQDMETHNLISWSSLNTLASRVKPHATTSSASGFWMQRWIWKTNRRASVGRACSCTSRSDRVGGLEAELDNVGNVSVRGARLHARNVKNLDYDSQFNCAVLIKAIDFICFIPGHLFVNCMPIRV